MVTQAVVYKDKMINMAKFDKLTVIGNMSLIGMVLVFYHKDIEIAPKVMKACYDGGIRVFEFTNRGDFVHEVFLEIIKYVMKECPSLAIGVGSIVDASKKPDVIYARYSWVCVQPEIHQRHYGSMPWTKLMEPV